MRCGSIEDHRTNQAREDTDQRLGRRCGPGLRGLREGQQLVAAVASLGAGRSLVSWHRQHLELGPKAYCCVSRADRLAVPILRCAVTPLPLHLGLSLGLAHAHLFTTLLLHRVVLRNLRFLRLILHRLSRRIVSLLHHLSLLLLLPVTSWLRRRLVALWAWALRLHARAEWALCHGGGESGDGGGGERVEGGQDDAGLRVAR